MIVSTTSRSATLSSDSIISAFHREGISLEISTPCKAYPDGRIAMMTNLNTTKSIKNFTLHAIVNGYKKNGYGIWSVATYIYKNQNFDAGIWPTIYTDINIPYDISPYLVYCFAESNWRVESEITNKNSSMSLHVEITYLGNIDYENLQNRYDVLQADYTITRTLMNALAATSLVFVGTTIYLMFIKRDTKLK